METMAYDCKKVIVAVNGRALTGFAEDGVVVLTHNEDIVTPSVGAKGDIVYSENANNSGNAALPLMSTSSSLAYLRDLCVRRRPLQISISDANSFDEIHVNEENCRILKMPDTPRNKAQTTVTVNVFIPDLNYR